MNIESEPRTDEYPLAQTPATKMIAAALDRLQAETGLTQRDIAKQLGYRSSVVLSHMALGRVPVPIDRVQKLARVLKLDMAELILAVLQQRYPDIDFNAVFGVEPRSESAVVAELEAIAGHPLDQLPPETLEVLREVVGSTDPHRRWLSLHEVVVMEMIRSAVPSIKTSGVPPVLRQQLSAVLRSAS